MELEKFKDANKNELSMIEVAHAILSQNGDVMAFADLTNKIQEFLGASDQEIRDRLAQFYTDLNVDGSFISLGDNLWGLRSWYPFDSIDEALVHSDDDEDDDRPRKKRKKVNAFLADASDDDDVIDYNDDDPEDEDLDADYDSDDDDDEDADPELKAYSKDLSDIGDTDDDEDDDLPDGIEGQLTELSDDDEELD
ncbi:DNA-directed RNA polymerase subunit delta [Ligilactobacillus agilis]|uniref:DNA-directed RNA polymerase subunit delta n=1 Tax=Ligilactobacillus agilis TaxID=1601 RepID=UPI001437C095|nr:DNA-directed RNA polymerase subunit delta [Ligilactobacillus agilis]MBM6762917.1 DNA-directed RNA polymerase subunit delta [Ligilactobacillus agilis]MDO4455212.1 DNA-directed RNA polymerase subunit delta [Ligilactobacillus agilis]GET16866.1 DNA-directed RNA polymerase subunit delta [Ligilactobacillus agilis]